MSSTSKSKAKSKSKSKETKPPPEREENQHEMLTPHQQRALDQLRELTNGADDEVSMGVLKSVEWDVQVCGFFAIFTSLIRFCA
jgi:nucleosome binding factor SPN SPT16 subunit